MLATPEPIFGTDKKTSPSSSRVLQENASPRLLECPCRDTPGRMSLLAAPLEMITRKSFTDQRRQARKKASKNQRRSRQDLWKPNVLLYRTTSDLSRFTGPTSIGGKPFLNSGFACPTCRCCRVTGLDCCCQHTVGVLGFFDTPSLPAWQASEEAGACGCVCSEKRVFACVFVRWL